jgi:hypothetical protein
MLGDVADELDGPFGPEVGRRRTDEERECPRLRDPSHRRVVEREAARRHDELDHGGATRVEGDRREVDELAMGRATDATSSRT